MKSIISSLLLGFGLGGLGALIGSSVDQLILGTLFGSCLSFAFVIIKFEILGEKK